MRFGYVINGDLLLKKTQRSTHSILVKPPWQKTKRKYRMGLRPIEKDAWITTTLPPEITNHKTTLLENQYEEVVAVTDESIRAQKILAKVLEIKVNTTYPDLIAIASANVVEDLLIIDTGNQNRLIAASVCSPSYWDVREKLGLPLWDIHQAVDGLNNYLGESINTFIKNLDFMKPFGRENWFIHGDDKRFHHHVEQQLDTEPENWFIRSERETLCRIEEDYVVFTINPRFTRLTDIFKFPEALQSLKQSLEGFSEDEIAYFGGKNKHETLSLFLENG